CLRSAPVALALVMALVSTGLARHADAPARPEVASLGGRPEGLRDRLMVAALVRHLEHRPADAEAGVLLGWLRAGSGDFVTGRALARYGASLDPQRRALADAARLEEPAAP